MSSLNKVLLIGNLGRDPETRYQPNGDCVSSFSIATTDKWIDKTTGEKQAKTEWHNIVAFRKLAEICDQYLRKGSSIYCEGKLRTTKYVDKDGIEKYSTKVVIDAMQMLGSRPTDEVEKQQLPPRRKEKTIIEQPQDTDFLDDDIPF